MKQNILFLSVLGCLTTGVNARDLGQWENADPAIRQWYQALMQPVWNTALSRPPAIRQDGVSA